MLKFTFEFRDIVWKFQDVESEKLVKINDQHINEFKCSKFYFQQCLHLILPALSQYFVQQHTNNIVSLYYILLYKEYK